MLKFYEIYHQKVVRTRPQYRLINDTNFTYVNFFRYILPILLREYPIDGERGEINILNLGSGSGTLDLFLGSLGYVVQGVDVSLEAVRAATVSAINTRLSNRVKFVQGDIESYKASKKYHVVMCLEVIEHCVEDRSALMLASASLEDDGLLILSTPLSTAPLSRLKLTDRFDKEVGHLRRYKKEDVISLIENNGFSIIELFEVEGILRNSLYVFSQLGILIKFIKGPISRIVTIIDDWGGKMLGYSDLIVIAKKQ